MFYFYSQGKGECFESSKHHVTIQSVFYNFQLLSTYFVSPLTLSLPKACTYKFTTTLRDFSKYILRSLKDPRETTSHCTGTVSGSFLASTTGCSLTRPHRVPKAVMECKPGFWRGLSHDTDGLGAGFQSERI